MKNVFVSVVFLLTFAATLLTACRKQPDFIPGNPENPGTPGTPGNPATNTFQFVVDTLPGGGNYAVSSINAVVTVANEKGEPVLTEKMLSFYHNGKYVTEKISLPAGAYQLTSFHIVYGSVLTHFATPKANSMAASLVKKPLPISFAVPSGTGDVPVEVARVTSLDRPEHFGYPSGAFDNNQSNNDPYIKVKVKVVVKVGDITYDSIRASLRLTVWDNKEEMTTSYISLQPGTNEISLPKSHVKYELHTTAVGVTDKKTLLRSELEGGELFVMGGSKAAKLLRSEMTYKLVNGNWVADSKNSYTYNASGQLTGVTYYLKDKDNKPYLAMTDELVYTNGRVERINRYDGGNTQLGFTTFAYDGQGRVVQMKEQKAGVETTADVQYLPMPHLGGDGVSVTYHYNHNGNTMRYVMTFYKGNKLNDNVFTSEYMAEEGRYEHDGLVNPYAHMNWPDLFFSHQSISNVKAQWVRYFYNYPTAQPYHFSYTYDADGYPKEVIKLFQSPLSYEFLYKTKTVYTY